MAQYVMRRLLLGVVTIWVVTLLLFGALRIVLPIFVGDVVDIMAGEWGRHDSALADSIRKEYGLDQSVGLQYLRWMADVVRGDLGTSLYTGQPVTAELRYRLPVSIELSMIGLLSAVLLAVPMGVIAAVNQDRWPDYLLRIWAVGTSAMPNFWIAILIITFGSLWFQWAPSVNYAPIWEDPVRHLQIILLPALLIGLTPSGGLVRLVRTQLLEVLRQDYIRTARSKGLDERRVVFKHALRNGLIPIVTVIGLQVPTLISGSALFEIIFVLPGTGAYLVNAVNTLDYPVIQGLNLLFATIIVSANIIVDVSYAYIDPRIRYR